MNALSRKTRRDLRLKFRAAAQSAPIELSVVPDVAPMIDELYPLYLQVYDRSPLHFEKLTKGYFCEIGKRMPDKVRFFVWRQGGRAVAFSLCMLEDDAIYAEYLGLDYAVALTLHLYHYAVRDVICWGMANGCKWFRSGGLNYDPKLHMRHVLDPLDLYVRHTSPLVNALLRRLLPLLEPTRYEELGQAVGRVLVASHQREGDRRPPVARREMEEPADASFGIATEDDEAVAVIVAPELVE